MKQSYLALLFASALLISACDDTDDPDNNALNESDKSFTETAAMSNMAEIELGEIAASRGSEPMVREYGVHMMEEHTKAQQDLLDITEDFNNVNWPEDLDAKHQQLKDQLMTMTGYKFDSMYMASQVMDHEMADSLFQVGMTNTTNSRVKQYANMYHPHIQEHLEKADSILTVLLASGMSEGD